MLLGDRVLIRLITHRLVDRFRKVRNKNEASECEAAKVKMMYGREVIISLCFNWGCNRIRIEGNMG